MARPRAHTSELRDQLVEQASAIVDRHGMAALAVRPLAEAAGTSTTAVYTLFGSKEALQQAVLIRSFEEFAAAQEGVGVSSDPIDDLAALGAVYMQWALDHPRRYEAMFGEALVGMSRTEAYLAASARSIVPLSEAVQRAIGARVFTGADVETVALSLWAQVHGLTSLVLAGRISPDQDLAGAAYAVIRGWQTHA